MAAVVAFPLLGILTANIASDNVSRITNVVLAVILELAVVFLIRRDYKILKRAIAKVAPVDPADVPPNCCKLPARHSALLGVCAGICIIIATGFNIFAWFIALYIPVVLVVPAERAAKKSLIPSDSLEATLRRDAAAISFEIVGGLLGLMAAAVAFTFTALYKHHVRLTPNEMLIAGWSPIVVVFVTYYAVREVLKRQRL